ncbi:hypothetical protein Ancab_015510 [Ancistrocladus abbreviatus]
MEELRQLQPDDTGKKKMLEILKRFNSQEEDSMDEDGGQISYDDLLAEEKFLFKRAVASREHNKMIEPWDPWWLKPFAQTISLGQDGVQLVHPLAKKETSGSSEDDSRSNLTSEIPPGPETPLPPISKLTSAKPSPLLGVHLIDIIYSYCFTLCLYNGDWQSDAIGAATVTCSPPFKHMGGWDFGFSLLDNVTSLDIVRWSNSCLRIVRPSEANLGGREGQQEEVWSSLVALVKAKKASTLEYHGPEGKSLKTEDAAKNHGKAFIEEMQ